MERLKNYVNGEWVESKSTESLDVENPATTETLAVCPMSTVEEIQEAIQAANEAYPEWRETPPVTRARYLFRLRDLMEQHFEDIARIMTMEHGKNVDESRGETRRAIEMVEVATGIPSLMQGYNLEDVSAGIDEHALIVPLGAFACIAPFNFPIMIPFWFMPFALATGNTYIVKPSSEVPMTMAKVFELVDEAGFPPGVANLINGSRNVSQALMTSKDIQGISFVGSSRVAHIVYETCSKTGQRVQAQGAAKNFLLVMPDANLSRLVPNMMASCFGCTGQRCLAGAVIVCLEENYEEVKTRIVEAVKKLRVGYGLDETTDVGPLASKDKMENTLKWIDKGLEEGAKLLVDGRGVKVDGYPKGYFVGPTVFDGFDRKMEIANEEIFGPVIGIMKVKDFDDAISVINANPYGNAASIYTNSGKHARAFRYRVNCGNIGINIGIAAALAPFPFAGMKESFLGDLHAQGRDVIMFFTDRKVVIERWV